MLILTRRVHESIIINDDINIRVLKLHGNQVRLGINAPKEVVIHREEIYQRVRQEEQLKRDLELYSEALSLGKSDIDIAKTLDISPNSVAIYRELIQERLNCADQKVLITKLRSMRLDKK